MDAMVSCEICLKEYIRDVVVPRVLNCVHTICTSCITQILQTSRSCPKCSDAFNEGNGYEDFPVNSSLLAMFEFIKNDLFSHTYLQHHLNIFQSKCASLETKFTEVQVNLENSLDLIATSLICIEERNDNESILKDLCNVSIQNYILLKNSKFLKYCDFSDKIKFIHEIYKRVYDGEMFYAVAKISEEIKFSRISVWSNKMILHAFGQPIEDPKIKTVWFDTGTKKTIEFQEIKNCLRTDNVRGLLEVSCNAEDIRFMIVIKPINSSLVPQFLKFCTGEMGPVYKGATYRQGTVSHINHSHASPVLAIDCVVNGDKGNENLEYISSLGTLATYTTDDLVVIGKSNGNFQIVRLANNVSLTDAIGKVEEPLNIRQMITHGIDRKITDSGIIIQL